MVAMMNMTPWHRRLGKDVQLANSLRGHVETTWAIARTYRGRGDRRRSRQGGRSWNAAPAVPTPSTRTEARGGDRRDLRRAPLVRSVRRTIGSGPVLTWRS